MKCPFCKSQESKVIDSRESEHGVRRRRACLACHKRFTTYERVDVVPLFVVKKDGRREEFNRQKLYAGLFTAAKKRRISPAQLEAAVDDIENTLRSRYGEVSTRDIGEEVMKRLRSLDPIAYVRFASVYRSFADAVEMRAILEELLAAPPGTRRGDGAGRKRRTRVSGGELEFEIDGTTDGAKKVATQPLEKAP